MLRAGVLIRRGETLFSRAQIAGIGQRVHFFVFFGVSRRLEASRSRKFKEFKEEDWVLRLCKAEE
jgi:hypothetical protein